MSAVNQNISKITEEVQILISQDLVPEAIDRLIFWIRCHTTSKDPLYEILIISSNYRRLDRQSNQGVIRFDEYQLYRNKLLYQIFALVERVSNEEIVFS